MQSVLLYSTQIDGGGVGGGLPNAVIFPSKALSCANRCYIVAIHTIVRLLELCAIADRMWR